MVIAKDAILLSCYSLIYLSLNNSTGIQVSELDMKQVNSVREEMDFCEILIETSIFVADNLVKVKLNTIFVKIFIHKA